MEVFEIKCPICYKLTACDINQTNHSCEECGNRYVTYFNPIKLKLSAFKVELDYEIELLTPEEV